MPMGLGDLFRRLSEPSSRGREEPEQSDPFASCRSIPHRIPMCEAPLRRPCTVAGLVRALDRVGSAAGSVLRAWVEDESAGTVMAQWHRRGPIRGLAEGVPVALTGTIRERNGTLIMLDPSYTLIEESADG